MYHGDKEQLAQECYRRAKLNTAAAAAAAVFALPQEETPEQAARAASKESKTSSGVHGTHPKHWRPVLGVALWSCDLTTRSLVLEPNDQLLESAAASLIPFPTFCAKIQITANKIEESLHFLLAQRFFNGLVTSN